MRHIRPLAAAPMLLVAAGCADLRPPPADDSPWVTGTTAEARQTGSLADPGLVESSGVAASRNHPGILWSHNDAGHGPILYATDTLGAARGRWTVAGARSVDWEDIALGPCPAGSCLYIGDVGDNREQRPTVMLYRVPEPDPAGGVGVTAAAESLSVRYPDRPRDVEALFVDSVGDTWLISKGRSGGIVAYRVPAAAWAVGQVIADSVAILPIPHSLHGARLVSGAAIAPDGERVVVRTYRDLFLMMLRDGRLHPAEGPNRCDVTGLQPQGEAVDWWDATTLVLTSEGAGGPVHLLRCGG